MIPPSFPEMRPWNQPVACLPSLLHGLRRQLYPASLPRTIRGVDKGPDEGFRSRHRLRRLRLGTLGFCVSLLSVSLAAAGLTDRWCCTCR
jgi:hypothetical protein